VLVLLNLPKKILYVFSSFLKVATDSEALVELGRSFHQQGTVMGKGPRNRFCASLRWYHKTTFASRVQVSGWHISLK